MHITTRSRYGLRAMLELALRGGAGRVQAHAIACAQNISPGYLEHLLSALRKASLVRSVRGQHGGYKLARPPEQISLREIVEALEGPLAPIDCVDDVNACEAAEHCAARDVWRKLAQAIADTLESMTLEDLCRRQRKLQQESPLMVRT